MKYHMLTNCSQPTINAERRKVKTKSCWYRKKEKQFEFNFFKFVENYMNGAEYLKIGEYKYKIEAAIRIHCNTDTNTRPTDKKNLKNAH